MSGRLAAPSSASGHSQPRAGGFAGPAVTITPTPQPLQSASSAWGPVHRAPERTALLPGLWRGTGGPKRAARFAVAITGHGFRVVFMAPLNAGLAAYNAARKAARGKTTARTRRRKRNRTAPARTVCRKRNAVAKKPATTNPPKRRKAKRRAGSRVGVAFKQSRASYRAAGQASSSSETNPEQTRTERGSKTKGGYLY